MGKLIVRPGRTEDVEAVQLLANNAKTLPFLGGWVMQQELVGMYTRGNESIPNHLVAELDGEVVGFSNTKGEGRHFLRFDLLAVDERVRRERIATSMYAAHMLRCGLAGRYFGRDQTIHFNDVMQEGYLPRLGFRHVVKIRYKIRNFSSLNWWVLDFNPQTLKHVLELAFTGPHKLELQVEDSERLKNDFEELQKLLVESDRVELSEQVAETRDYADERIRLL